MDQEATPANPSGPKNNSKWIIVSVVALLLIGASLYFLAGNKKNIAPTQVPSGNQAVSPTTMQSASPSTTAQTSQNVVTLTANGFTPATLTIKAGQTVTWINKSGEMATVNSNPHPVHTAYPPLNLGTFANDASLSLTFPTAGTYGYHNHLNPSETGTIVVK